ncbi:MAG: hypothetical protein MUF64_16120 [Polyangiaceae bacterium]|nr:hypothetical protein [Polyangiaceae bacterium]
MAEHAGDLLLPLADRHALRVEYERNLRKGRAFVPGPSPLLERQRCRLDLQLPGAPPFTLHAEVVYLKPDEPGQGVGLRLDPWGPEEQASLLAFVEEPERVQEDPLGGLIPVEEEPRSPLGLQERVRRMTAIEQQRLAQHGSMQERILLERTFGPAVWEALLGNPRITTPEVARIAKKGSIPRPLIDTIAGNSAWLATAEVQRALLSNPRTGPHLLPRILRSLSRADLALVPQQGSYPSAVRAAAKKMLQGS